MKHTANFRLNKPEDTDYFDIEDLNANADAIDAELQRQKNIDTGQSEKIKELQNPTYTVAESRKNIVSGEKIGVIFGKIARFFSDLKTVAFSGSYEDLSNKPQSLPANGGNADTVNGHTVNSDVPSGAKFTDTNTWRPQPDWNATSGDSAIKNKPTIPSVGNGTVTITQNGTTKGTFTMNQSGNTTIAISDNNTTYGTGNTSTAGLTKLYTATGTATDGTMTQNAIKTALDGKANSSHAHAYIPLNTSGGIASCGGDGKYTYFKVATIKITASYINRPVVFEMSGRGKCLSQVTVMFESVNNTDPALSLFRSNQENSFWIKKTATSTWEIYGQYNEVYGSYVLHRITGAGADIGITVNMVNISSLPSGCTQVSYGGNANYANSAGSVEWGNVTGRPSSLPANGGNANTVNNHTVNADVPSGAKFTDTNTWRPQPDWNATSGDSAIKNKPTIPNVANNLTTNVAGYALDARQGKALKDSVDALNGSLNEAYDIINLTLRYEIIDGTCYFIGVIPIFQATKRQIYMNYIYDSLFQNKGTFSSDQYNIQKHENCITLSSKNNDLIYWVSLYAKNGIVNISFGVSSF